MRPEPHCCCNRYENIFYFYFLCLLFCFILFVCFILSLIFYLILIISKAEKKLLLAGPMEVSHVLLTRPKPFEGPELKLLQDKEITPFPANNIKGRVKYAACGAFHCGAVTGKHTLSLSLSLSLSVSLSHTTAHIAITSFALFSLFITFRLSLSLPFSLSLSLSLSFSLSLSLSLTFRFFFFSCSFLISLPYP